MAYFDPTYFDPTYFDCGPSPSVGGGHAKSLPGGRQSRQGLARPLPAWLAIAARKRKRIEDEELRKWLAAKRAWLRLTDDEYLLDLSPLPARVN